MIRYRTEHGKNHLWCQTSPLCPGPQPAARSGMPSMASPAPGFLDEGGKSSPQTSLFCPLSRARVGHGTAHPATGWERTKSPTARPGAYAPTTVLSWSPSPTGTGRGTYPDQLSCLSWPNVAPPPNGVAFCHQAQRALSPWSLKWLQGLFLVSSQE